jgi:D-tyrosyl-tRNA(Tyr) deacylase
MRQNVAMRAVIQRVDGASCTVHGRVTGEFAGPGLMVLVGIHVEDTVEKCAVLADKIWKLRIFQAETLQARGIDLATEAVEVSAADANLPILVISQFTLHGDTTKGRRPTWLQAARGDVAEPLVAQVVAQLRSLGATVATGEFGADMRITQVNDGPMTILLEI